MNLSALLSLSLVAFTIEFDNSGGFGWSIARHTSWPQFTSLLTADILHCETCLSFQWCFTAAAIQTEAEPRDCIITT